MKTASSLKHCFWYLLAIAAATRLLCAAEVDSQDFQVYWKAIHAWFAGSNPYLYTAAERGFVFKYPPWMIPVFTPLAWLEFNFAKGVWATLQLFTLIYCVKWMARACGSMKAACVSAALFWFIWLGHFFSGQVTIFLLMSFLWTVKTLDHPNASFRKSVLVLLFTAKVFTAYALGGLLRQLFQPRVLAWTAALFVTAHLILIWKAGQFPETLSLNALYSGFFKSATSGAAELGPEVVRGSYNHSFVAMVLRHLDPQGLNYYMDILLSGILALCLGVAWIRFSKNLDFYRQMSGWLAISVVAHPLAWHHSFVLCYPLCTFALSDAWKELASRRSREGHRSARFTFWGVILGLSMIGILVPQVVGVTVVKPFELFANKSWGVLLCACLLVWVEKARSKEANG